SITSASTAGKRSRRASWRPTTSATCRPSSCAATGGRPGGSVSPPRTASSTPCSTCSAARHEGSSPPGTICPPQARPSLRARPPPMLPGLGWLLQALALVIVGRALIFGLISDRIRLELAVAAAGGVLFLLGKWLQSREGRERPPPAAPTPWSATCVS